MSKTRRIFANWASEWLEMVKPTVKGNTYAASYQNPVNNHLIPYFGKMRIGEISDVAVQEYFNILAKKYSLDTLKKQKSCLNRIFERAIFNGLCVKNPVRYLIMPQTKEAAEKKIYAIEQARLVFNYGYIHRFGAEIQFMLETGVSRGELLALRWSDVNFEESRVNIRNASALVPNSKTGKLETVIGKTKNRYRNRIIPLSPEICRILREIPQKSIYIFCNKDGNNNNPRTWSRRHFAVFMRDMRDYYAKTGIEIPAFNSHQLRHTLASFLVNGNKNIFAVAKLLGHADLEMMYRRYVHSDFEEVRRQIGIDKRDLTFDVEFSLNDKK